MKNPVSKNMEKFNRPATHKDKKKENKKGYKKHKENHDGHTHTLPRER